MHFEAHGISRGQPLRNIIIKLINIHMYWLGNLRASIDLYHHQKVQVQVSVLLSKLFLFLQLSIEHTSASAQSANGNRTKVLNLAESYHSPFKCSQKYKRKKNSTQEQQINDATSNKKTNLPLAEVHQTDSESQRRCLQHKRFLQYSYKNNNILIFTCICETNI